VSKLRGKRRSAKGSARRVRIGVPDGSLAALAGLAAVDELTGRLGMVTELDRGIGPIKQRDRGLTGGQLLMGMAAAQLVGQDCLAGLDRVRADAGSALLAEAAVAPSTTAGRLAAGTPRWACAARSTTNWPSTPTDTSQPTAPFPPRPLSHRPHRRQGQALRVTYGQP
jgi:hypothetical protein